MLTFIYGYLFLAAKQLSKRWSSTEKSILFQDSSHRNGSSRFWKLSQVQTCSHRVVLRKYPVSFPRAVFCVSASGDSLYHGRKLLIYLMKRTGAGVRGFQVRLPTELLIYIGKDLVGKARP